MTAQFNSPGSSGAVRGHNFAPQDGHKHVPSKQDAPTAAKAAEKSMLVLINSLATANARIAELEGALQRLIYEICACGSIGVEQNETGFREQIAQARRVLANKPGGE